MFGRSLKSLSEFITILLACFVCLFVCLFFGLESSDILINLFYFILSSYYSDISHVRIFVIQWTVCSLPVSSNNHDSPARILEGLLFPPQGIFSQRTEPFS